MPTLLCADPNQELCQIVARALGAVAGVSAVGEIGLDYRYDFSPRDVQRAVLRRQARLASERGLPVVVHARLSEGDVLDVLENLGQQRPRGVFHCFTGDRRAVERFVGAGYYVGVGGILTFPSSARRPCSARSVLSISVTLSPPPFSPPMKDNALNAQ